MDPILTYITFGIGFVLLIKGADFLVDGATSIANKFGLSPLIIGLTIVSFGTSLPELIVSMVSSSKGSSELAIGNILGSNIANGLLVLGVSAIFADLPIRKSTIRSEIPFALVATLLVGFLANANLFGNVEAMKIDQLEGGIMLFFLALFLAYIMMIAREGSSSFEGDDTENYPMPKAILFIVIGMVGLFLGGKWVVDGAIVIAGAFGLSESLIGLTVVSIGTSLPELVTSAVAAYRKNVDIAVGNVIGSNIFNLLWILGLTACINPIPFDIVSNTDILMVIFTSVLLLFAVVFGRRGVIDRWDSAVFLTAYIGYIVYLVYRG